MKSNSPTPELVSSPAPNTDNLTFRFNGDPGPYNVWLSKNTKSATVEVSVYPPKADIENSAEKEYPVVIGAMESADVQIYRDISRDMAFADLRSPRATITAPYDSERISPKVFKGDKKFKIEAYSDDQNLSKIQIEIRSKKTDGVWEPWENLSGMFWEDGGKNKNVTVVTHSDRDPIRREFTFDWSGDDIATHVGEYALRAVARDKATRLQTDGSQADNPNIDLDAPAVEFQVDGSKPTVLTTTPDYQARESERIYRSELSVLFNDDMRADDFTDRTFYVIDLLNNSEEIAGFVSYSPALRKAIFVPKVPFQPNGFFRVEIKTDTERETVDDDGNPITVIDLGVHDLAGNPLDNEFTFTFRTNDTPFEETWSLILSATEWTGDPNTEEPTADNTTALDANNIAAVEYGALDDEDEKDARAVPVLDSQLSFKFLNRSQTEFDRDTRPADGRLSHHWFCAIDNPKDGSNVTIKYQPSSKLAKSEDLRQYKKLQLVEFDSNGDVTNTIELHPEDAEFNPTTEKYDSLEAYTYTPEVGETTRNFRLDVKKASFVATAFENGSSGWKFFSAPITPERADPFVNLGDDIEPFKLYKYDTETSGYKIYPLDLGEVSLQTGHGYFTRLSEDAEVDVGGASNSDDIEIELADAGWHAIGNPFVKSVNVADLKINDKTFDTAVSEDLIEGTLYRWDVNPEDSDAYEAIDSSGQLNTWDGCWLKTKSANLTLTIPAPDNLEDYVAPLPPSFDPPMAPSSVMNLAVHDERVLKKGEFDLRFELTSDSSSDMITALGTRQNAKVALDGFDQSEPPRLNYTVSAYFVHSDWKHDQGNSTIGRYNTDYRPLLEIGTPQTWNLVVYTDKPKAKMCLSWEDAIEQMPDDVMFTLKHGSSGKRGLEQSRRLSYQDMRKVRFVELDSESRITKVNFEIRAERFEMKPLEDTSVIADEAQVKIQWLADDNSFITGYTVAKRLQEKNGRMEEWKKTNLQLENLPIIQLSNHSVFQYIDTDVAEEVTYTYQLITHYKTGAEVKSEKYTVTVLPVIEKTALLQNYPNPFNPETWIPYELEREADVKIEIYNISGQNIRTLELGVQPRGRYVRKEKAAYWDGRNSFGERVASGVYFYVMKTDGFVSTKKMLILK